MRPPGTESARQVAQIMRARINPSKVLRTGDRPVPITDMGEPVKQAFA